MKLIIIFFSPHHSWPILVVNLAQLIPPSFWGDLINRKSRTSYLPGFSLASYIIPFLPPFCACVLSRFWRVWLCATLCTVAHQAPLSMGFSRQEYWSGLPCPSPRDLPDPKTDPTFLMSPALWVLYHECQLGSPLPPSPLLMHAISKYWNDPRFSPFLFLSISGVPNLIVSVYKYINIDFKI